MRQMCGGGEMSESLKKFIRWSKKSSLAIALGILVGAATTLLTLTDSVFKFTDRLGITQSEAFQLADNSSKAQLSEQLIEGAWNRLFFANLFAYRIEDKAPLSDIDEAWKEYVESDARWNSNVMKYLVGLDRYYGEKKSRWFEQDVQSEFSSLDTALRALHSSTYLARVRQLAETRKTDLDAAISLAQRIHAIHDRTQTLMYIFVRCITPPGNRQVLPANWRCN